MKTLVIIPARWESTRLPGKPLAMIGDKPMIQHTWEKVMKSEADEVIIATDSKLIYDAAEEFGARVIWTPEYDTGTERVIAIQKIKGADFVINVQGDEPFIDPLDINKVINMVKQNTNWVATMKTDLTYNEATDPNTVKIVTDQFDSALMFTRSNVYKPSDTIFKHVGIYGYSSKTLEAISKMTPSKNSINNSLEQLTWLDNNIMIMSGYTEQHSFGIDTPLDLQLANKLYK
jgi:3-deoxy-manno-octulosonate cytidylyltransferase (CMP-KDO synthetase)